MPIPTDCIRLSYLFNLRDDAGSSVIESGVFNVTGRRVHFAGNDTDWPADIQEMADKARDKWKTNMLPASFGGAVVMDRVKAYHLGTNNKTIDEGQALFDGSNAFAGTGGTTMPWETTLAVSLFGYDAGAFTQDARSKRGRFFLPPANTSMIQGNTGTAGGTAFTNLVGSVGDLLNDLQGMEFSSSSGEPESDYFDLGIISVTHNLFTPATRYNIGNVFDAQRRRRKNQVEVRSGGTIAHS